MHLPFTEAQFLDVFAAYNTALWPAVVVLWVATLILTAQFARGRVDSRLLSAFAAVHWAWSGAVYHAVFFTRINPAAWLFAALFLGQAGLFIWYGVARRRLTFTPGRSPRHAVAGGLLVYSLLYPLLIWLSGIDVPRGPMFAVPCPTVLFTAGLLLAVTPPVPRWLVVAPTLWSVIGGSAALLFGMTPDLMLFAAGACLTIYGARQTPRRLATAA